MIKISDQAIHLNPPSFPSFLQHYFFCHKFLNVKYNWSWGCTWWGLCCWCTVNLLDFQIEVSWLWELLLKVHDELSHWFPFLSFAHPKQSNIVPSAPGFKIIQFAVALITFVAQVGLIFSFWHCCIFLATCALLHLFFVLIMSLSSGFSGLWWGIYNYSKEWSPDTSYFLRHHTRSPSSVYFYLYSIKSHLFDY